MQNVIEYSMNRYHALALTLFILGIVMIAYSVASGEGGALLFFIIPVFYGTGIFSFIGVACIMFALFLTFLGFVKKFEFHIEGVDDQAEDARVEKEVKGGGVVLIGPIPIIFGSDVRTLISLIILTIVLIVITYILFFL